MRLDRILYAISFRSRRYKHHQTLSSTQTNNNNNNRIFNLHQTIRPLSYFNQISFRKFEYFPGQLQKHQYRWNNSCTTTDDSTIANEMKKKELPLRGESLVDMEINRFPTYRGKTPTNVTGTPVSIKGTKELFDETWEKIERESNGKSQILIPSELVFLMGSPASGKGTHAQAIMTARGITNPLVIISDLLKTSYKEKIDKGEMIDDKDVLESLLRALMKCDARHGALVDGFPRTETQVEFLKHLHNKIAELRKEHFHSAQRNLYRRPIFRICVLYVDEKISLERQLKRGRKAREHNEKVTKSGNGKLVEERPTDFDVQLIKRRYEIFLEHYGALLKLRELFSFHLIDASKSEDQVLAVILKEFEYQSSIELDQDTFDMIQPIPIATEIGLHARQNLVRRLENYQMFHDSQFRRVISMLEKEFIPVISKHALSGTSIVRTENPLIGEELAIDMILDTLSERGYFVTYDCESIMIPDSMDKETFKISCKERRVHIFKVSFTRQSLRNSTVPNTTNPSTD